MRSSDRDRFVLGFKLFYRADVHRMSAAAGPPAQAEGAFRQLPVGGPTGGAVVRVIDTVTQATQVGGSAADLNWGRGRCGRP